MRSLHAAPVVAVLAIASSCLYPPDPPDAGNLDGSADGVSDASSVPVFNRCTTTRFVDQTDPVASRNVYFGGVAGSPGFGYAPACIIIAAGQSVTWNGEFDEHPLTPGTDPSDLAAGSPGNPIQRVGTGSSVTFTFPTAGTYPYFCEQHYADGMAGVVEVE